MANNGEKSGKLTTRQRRMIAAMLASKNIGEACETARVGRSTLARWLDQGHFISALRKAQGEAITHAGSALIAAQETAINTLIMLADRARNEGVKRAAANDLLAYSLKFHDQVDIEERLERLEKAVLHGK
jgi:hypothetical protein